MIAPLDLSTEEREIYWLLYRRMDFNTFEVKYTLDQLAYDSSQKLELTKKKVSTIIKKFMAEDLLTVIYKGTKGNPTIYLITKMADVKEHKGNLTDTQKELKGNLKGTNEVSDTNTLDDVEELKGNLKETQRELKGNTKVTPINDIDKETNKDIYNYYLSLDLIKHNTYTPAMEKAIKLAITQNKYSVEDCKALLQKHKKVIEITKGNEHPVKKRSLVEFFGQKIKDSTALICTQYEDGGKYYSLASNNLVKANNPNRKIITRRDEF